MGKKLTDAKVEYLAHERVSYGSDEDEKAQSEAFSVFNTQFTQFRRKKIKNKYKLNDQAQYPHTHRFVALIDRRKPNDDNKQYVTAKDEIIFYEAKPTTLPKEPCSLWFFESSKTCIIPGTEGKKDSMAEKVKTSLDHCMGSLMILSFHCESEDSTKCYLYLHGQLLRFFAEDIIKLLPRYFVDDERNKEFVESEEAKQMTASIKDTLRDKKFEEFYKRFQ